MIRISRFTHPLGTTHGTVPPHPGAGLSPGRRAVSWLSNTTDGGQVPRVSRHSTSRCVPVARRPSLLSRLIEAFLAWLCPPEPRKGRGYVSVRELATVQRPASQVTFSRN